MYVIIMRDKRFYDFVHHKHIKYSTVNFKFRIIFSFEQMVTTHYANI